MPLNLWPIEVKAPTAALPPPPEKLSFGIVEKSKLNMPVEVIDTAKELYEKLIERGDPYIEYYKHRSTKYS